MLIAIILFYGLVFVSAKKKAKFFSNELYEDGWSYENTTALRGILAISVLFHHLYSKDFFILPYIGTSFAYFGSLAVSTFFCLSGYALQLKTEQSGGEYLKNFFSKRFSKILYPYIVFVFLYIVITKYTLGKTLFDVFEQYRWGNPVSNSWYVIAILIFYVLFYAANRIKDGKGNIILIFAFTILYIILLVTASKTLSDYLCIPEWYYRSLILFPIGCFIGKYKFKVEEFLRKFYLQSFFIVTLILLLGYLFPAIYRRTIVNYWKINQWFIQQFLIGVFGTIDIMLIMLKISVNNKITQFLGNVSYEIYLVHGLVIMCLSSFMKHSSLLYDELFMLNVSIISVIASILLKTLFDLIKRITNKGEDCDFSR